MHSELRIDHGKTVDAHTTSTSGVIAAARLLSYKLFVSAWLSDGLARPVLPAYIRCKRRLTHDVLTQLDTFDGLAQVVWIIKKVRINHRHSQRVIAAQAYMAP